MKLRHLRMASLIERIVAMHLVNTKEAMLTVVDVQVSIDLRHADVWLSSLDPKAAVVSDEWLENLRPKVQQAIAANLKTRYAPKLKLHFDLNQNQRVDQLIDKL